jgi:hypothetical protein
MACDGLTFDFLLSLAMATSHAAVEAAPTAMYELKKGRVTATSLPSHGLKHASAVSGEQAASLV